MVLQNPSSIDILHPETLTAVVNERKDPQNFVKNAFFAAEQAVPTRHIEVSVQRRGRIIAPLVKRDGAAIMTPGSTHERYNLMPAHSRTKRAMAWTDLFEKRQAGAPIFMDAGGQNAARAQYVNEQLDEQMDDLMNLEEYLACLALRGSFTYTGGDDVAIEVDYRRDAAHDIVLAGGDLWTAASSSKIGDFQTASELVNDAVSMTVSDVILGTEAADAFIADASDEFKGGFLLDHRRVQSGTLDFTQTFNDQGALFLGQTSMGIRVWRYGRQLQLPEQAGGGSVDLIRPKYAEFIAGGPAAQRLFYYGAIEDLGPDGQANLIVSKRYSKSWAVQDPSANMLLVESNPLPHLRRPDASVSMQVVA